MGLGKKDAVKAKIDYKLRSGEARMELQPKLQKGCAARSMTAASATRARTRVRACTHPHTRSRSYTRTRTRTCTRPRRVRLTMTAIVQTAKPEVAPKLLLGIKYDD